MALTNEVRDQYAEQSAYANPMAAMSMAPPSSAPEALHDGITRCSIELSESSHVLAAAREDYFTARSKLEAAEVRFQRATDEMGKLVGAMSSAVSSR